jgi:hypothetical protein
MIARQSSRASSGISADKRNKFAGSMSARSYDK